MHCLADHTARILYLHLLCQGRSFKLMDPHQKSVSESAHGLQALMQAHADLSRHVSQLTLRLSTLSRNTTAELAEMKQNQLVSEDDEVRRLLLFATANANKVLKTPHPDLATAARKMRPSSTFKQGMLKSKASDCSLADFRTLLRYFLRKETTKCRAYPSEFYALATDGGKSERFDIIFDTFSDLCDALSISANTRELGAYREKKISGEVQAVHVSGVVRFSHGQGPDRQRFILIGNSTPAHQDDCTLHVLSQANMAWSEHSWDCNLRLETKTLTDVLSTTSLPPSYDDEETRTRISDLNLSPIQLFSFRITWERNVDAKRYPQVPDSLVAGSIRSYFPTVFIGTRILLDSVRSIFATRRPNGRLLTDIVICPR